MNEMTKTPACGAPGLSNNAFPINDNPQHKANASAPQAKKRGGRASRDKGDRLERADRIEVGAVGRQEEDPCALGPYGLLGGRAFVG